MNRSSFDDGEHMNGPNNESTDLYDVLPPAMPAAREWSGGFIGLAGLACLAGFGTILAERFGLTRGMELADRATQAMASVGATPALLAVGGAVLVGLAAGARGRRRQTQRVMDALGQMPDYGAWLEDLDGSLQRLHVSLVTVEARVSGSIEHTANVLEQRLARPEGNQETEIAELGARLMRVGSTVDHLSAGVSRLEEHAARPHQDARMGELLERVARLTARVESLQRMPASEPTTATKPVLEVVQEVLPAPTPMPVPTARQRIEEARVMPSVDDPAPAMPRHEVVEIDVDTESAVAGLPLFAGIEEPQRAPVASERLRRNPYER